MGYPQLRFLFPFSVLSENFGDIIARWSFFSHDGIADHAASCQTTMAKRPAIFIVDSIYHANIDCQFAKIFH